jgi:cysteine desulfurase/selenocysteine lyase
MWKKDDRRGFLRTAASLAAALPQFSNAHESFGVSMLMQESTNPRTLRDQFPLLSQKVNGHDLAFLDNAATAQRPLAVIQAMTKYYMLDNANPSATMHTLARRSAALYSDARQTVAHFVNANAPDEIVWTHGTTEAINLVATSWGGANIHSGDEIILTVAEHYSNLVPWQLLAQRTGAKLKFVDVDDEGHLRLTQLKNFISRRTKLVAFSHVSNVLGLINPVREICDLAHQAGALAFVDGAQSAPHVPIDVQALGYDFFAFSGHKIMGPMGTGILWARKDLLNAMPPYQSGSIMIHSVDINSTPTHFEEGALKFNAGSPNAAGAIGLAAAIKFMESLDKAALRKHDQDMTRHALARLAEVKGLRILGPKGPADRISVLSFVLGGHKAAEVMQALDAEGIAVRAGDLAALPLLKRMGTEEAVRASCYIYSTSEEIDRLADVLQKLQRAA